MKEHVFTNLSRKTFLRGSLAAAVAASSASLLSACGGSAGGDSDKKVLRFGVNNPKVTFDTQKTSGSVGSISFVSGLSTSKDSATASDTPTEPEVF